jgi:hypothetical protein
MRSGETLEVGMRWIFVDVVVSVLHVLELYYETMREGFLQ